MNYLHRWSIVVASAAFFIASPAWAQWNTLPNHALGVSRGPGVSTPNAVSPGTSGYPLVSNGASSDPSFQILTAPNINYTAPGTGALTITQQAFNNFYVELKNFAPGNGTDQTTGIQAAFTYAKLIGAAIDIPCGNYTVSTTIDITAVSWRGKGSCSQFTTTANIPIFQVNIDSQNVYYQNYSSVSFVGNVIGTRTSLAGIRITGTAAANGFNYNTIANIRCLAVYACIRFSVNKTGTGGEEGTDWNNISGIQTTGASGVSTDYGILYDNGSGTGNVISNSNFVFDTAGIRIAGANGNNAGDLTLTGIQMGGAGTCFSFSGTAAYRQNISIGNVQCDAGPTTFISADGYSFKLGVSNIGGGVTSSATNTFNSAQDVNAFERRYGQFKTIASTSSDNFFSVTFPNLVYGGASVEITASGLVQSIGHQTRTSRYHITENGNCASITATQLDTYAAGSVGTPLTFSTSLSSCTVTFTLNFPGGTAANSNIMYAARVSGYQFEAAMR